MRSILVVEQHDFAIGIERAPARGLAATAHSIHDFAVGLEQPEQHPQGESPLRITQHVRVAPPLAEYPSLNSR
jgi:hypothetical protein